MRWTEKKIMQTKNVPPYPSLPKYTQTNENCTYFVIISTYFPKLVKLSLSFSPEVRICLRSRVSKTRTCV